VTSTAHGLAIGSVIPIAVAQLSLRGTILDDYMNRYAAAYAA
jgi:hypothetical protein